MKSKRYFAVLFTIVVLVAFQFASIGCSGSSRDSGGGPPAVPGPTGSGIVDVTRTYYAYHVPAGHDSTTAWPLFVFLHGGGMSGDIWVNVGAAAADARSFIYIAPDSTGEDPYGPGTVKSWDWVTDEANITECIESAMSKWYIDVNRIYVGGFSLGGTMAMVYATGPECVRLAAFADFCGTWPWLSVTLGPAEPRKVPGFFTSQAGDGNYVTTQNREGTFSSNGHVTTWYDDSARLDSHWYDAQSLANAFDWMKDFSLD